MTKEPHIKTKPHHIDKSTPVTPHNDESTLQKVKNTSHNDKITSHEDKSIPHKDKSTSQKDKSTPCT